MQLRHLYFQTNLMEAKQVKKMIFRSSIVVAALLGFYWFNTGPKIQPGVDDKEALTLKAMMQTIEYTHLNPKAIDDELSKAVYKLFLKRIDGGKRYLTQKDINYLSQYETQIDDQIRELRFDFFDESSLALDKGLEKAEKFFMEAIDDKIDVNRPGTYQVNPDSLAYAKEDADLKLRWSQIIQWEVNAKWLNSIEKQEKDTIQTNEKKPLDSLKADAIKDVRKRYVDFFERVKKLRRSDRMETYLSSISNYFDPHTDYFSPIEKQNFDIGMGGKLEGIGARLQLEGEYTKIFSIVVGGPAWKTKKLEDNDIIMKIAQEGQDPIDIAGMRLDDVVQMIRGKKGTTVVLTVKKKDNSIVDIAIVRDEVQLEDGKAKSVILNMPGNVQHIGYIYLPKFYSSFETDGGNSCAVDVATELRKLKAENVNGVILDLRNNSGGSLNDVVDMSGFFIEKGPIVQVKGKDSRPSVYQDKDGGVVYDGPLIIMVNQNSASASEIIAAAMQDYNRAIIVGSKSTFGKGTVQRFYDLDRVIGGYDQFKPLGNVKMTTQKFYRVNGGSTQMKGVIPDIILPDFYQFINIGEKEYEYAMEWTEIEPTKYSQSVVVLENKNKVIDSSMKRVAGNAKFDYITKRAAKFKKQKDESSFPLDFKSYRAVVEQRDKEDDQDENIVSQDIANFEIFNLAKDLEKINEDEGSKARNDEFIKGLKKDIYLEETMYIIRDMINMESSFATIQPKLSSK